MAKYNGIITAFKKGAKLLEKVEWTTNTEISTTEDWDQSKAGREDKDPVYFAKNKHIKAMCAIGAMKRALYLEYKDQYQEKNGSLKGWDDKSQIEKVEEICNDAEYEFYRFLSKKKNRKMLNVPDHWWNDQDKTDESIIEHFNDGPAGEGEDVIKALLAAAEQRYERLKRKAEKRASK